jgi:hypothetical protein
MQDDAPQQSSGFREVARRRSIHPRVDFANNKPFFCQLAGRRAVRLNHWTVLFLACGRRDL